MKRKLPWDDNGFVDESTMYFIIIMVIGVLLLAQFVRVNTRTINDQEFEPITYENLDAYIYRGNVYNGTGLFYVDYELTNHDTLVFVFNSPGSYEITIDGEYYKTFYKTSEQRVQSFYIYDWDMPNIFYPETSIRIKNVASGAIETHNSDWILRR